MTMLKWSVPVVAVVLAGVGCHARPPAVSPDKPAAAPQTVPATPPAPPPPPAAAARPSSEPLSEEELFQRKSLDELNRERPLGDAFFDYDQDALRDDARSVLQRNAAWLAKWPHTRILVEGHCDERGTAEYNVALGDRRVKTIREYLATLGVSQERIVTRSVGKEAPFCQGSGEDCWSQNRRGHFLITAK
jgi:peptidoglycan-associated lipoprotein